MPERPAVIQASVLERLEGRLALSSMTSYPLSRADIADVFRNTAEVAVVGSTFDNRGSKTLAAELFDSSISGQTRARANVDLGLTSEREDRGDLGNTIALRRPSTQVDLTRGALNPIEASPRTRKLPGHSYGLRSLESVPVPLELSEAAGASMLPLVDNTPGLVLSTDPASEDSSGMVVGFDSPVGSWRSLALTASAASGAGTAAIAGQDLSRPPPETKAGTNHPVDDVSRLDIAALVPGAQRAATNLADLLEGVFQSDWDDIELEMRQFLSRLGTMVDGSGSHSVVPKWPAWIGTAAIAVVLRRFSQGIRLRGRQITSARGLDRRQHPSPLGPWPLDSV